MEEPHELAREAANERRPRSGRMLRKCAMIRSPLPRLCAFSISSISSTARRNLALSTILTVVGYGVQGLDELSGALTAGTHRLCFASLCCWACKLTIMPHYL